MKRSNILRRKPMDVPSMHEAYEYTENMREACENVCVCVCNATLATMCRATTSECSYKSVSVWEVKLAGRKLQGISQATFHCDLSIGIGAASHYSKTGLGETAVHLAPSITIQPIS